MKKFNDNDYINKELYDDDLTHTPDRIHNNINELKSRMAQRAIDIQNKEHRVNQAQTWLITTIGLIGVSAIAVMCYMVFQ